MISDKEMEHEFSKKYGHLKKQGLQINGMVINHGGEEVFAVSIPFIFDQRQLPEKFMKFHVKKSIYDVPAEFESVDRTTEYIWAYQRYEKFVAEYPDLIKTKLGDPGMTKEEM